MESTKQEPSIGAPNLALRAIRTASQWVPGRLLMPLARRAADGREWRVRLRGSKAEVVVSFKSMMEAAVLLTGYWERKEAAAIRRWVKPGHVALDIGANVGLHTMRMADLVGPTGHVYGFEPNPEVFERLARNIAVNGYRHVTPLASGLGMEAGTVTLYVNNSDNWNRNATMLADPQSAGASAVSVPIMPLDEVWTTQMGRRRIDFIKVDIEGYELNALRSGDAMLRTCRPVILSEFSQHYCGLLGLSWGDVRAFYESRGYTLSDLAGAPLGAAPAGAIGFNFVAVPHG